MTSARSNPQQDHISSMSYGPDPAGQWQFTTQQDADNVIPSCPCSWCSRSRYDHQAAMPTRDYQNPWFLTNPVAQYADQSPVIDNPTGITTITNGQMMARPVGQQAPWDPSQENLNGLPHAPRYEAVGFLQAHNRIAPIQGQIDMPVLDSLRRLAERYFDHPESLVSAVRFECGPSGRLQVVIMLEIADIL